MEMKCEELSVAVKFVYLRTSMKRLGALYQTTDCIADTLMHLNDEMLLMVVVISEPRGIK